MRTALPAPLGTPGAHGGGRLLRFVMRRNPRRVTIANCDLEVKSAEQELRDLVEWVNAGGCGTVVRPDPRTLCIEAVGAMGCARGTLATLRTEEEGRDAHNRREGEAALAALRGARPASDAGRDLVADATGAFEAFLAGAEERGTYQKQGGRLESYRMRHLDLRCSRFMDKTVQDILLRSPDLQVLDLASCAVTDATAAAIASSCPKLHSLRLQMVRGLTETGLAGVVTRCVRLKALSLAWVPCAAACVPAIAEHCKRLEQLDISGCRELILDEQVLLLAKGCPQLVTLNLSDNYKLTNASVDAIVQHLHRISNVGLSRDHRITVEAMRSLATKPTLQSLQVFGCFPQIFPVLKSECPHLKINSEMLGQIGPFA